MNPEMAKHLFATGAVLVVAGVPIGTEFGIDLSTYTIGEQFRGVKMIPPGVHHIWCASRGPYGDVAPRVGFAHYFQSGEIVVREWDHSVEELRERQIPNPEVEKRHIKESLLELDRFLAPYDFQTLTEWKQLTDTITEATLTRCRPALGTIRTNAELLSCPDSERPRGPAKGVHPQNSKLVTDENDLLPNLKPVEGTAPRFTPLPERVPKHALPGEVSQHCMDCVAALDELLQRFSTVDALIEELQLSFAFFLVGYSVESLAHWRKLLNLLSHSETAVSKYKLLYMKFSEILSHQLPHLPEELMLPNENNTVFRDVRLLLVNLHCNGLSVSAERLMKKLNTTMEWTFPDLLEDDPEDMPVVVDLPAEMVDAIK